MKSFSVLPLAFLGLLVAVSNAFAPSRQGLLPLRLTSEIKSAREDAIESYLARANEETAKALLMLEREKEHEIGALKMQLYQDLNAALREKEIQSLRLKLESLRETIQSQLQYQKSLDESEAYSKANELQDVRIQLDTLLSKLFSMGNGKNSMQSAKKASPSQNNGLNESKKFPNKTINPQKPAVKKNGSVAAKSSEPKRKIGVIYGRAPVKKENSVESKSTIKLGPFTPRD